MTKDICAFTFIVKQHVTTPAGLIGIMFMGETDSCEFCHVRALEH